MNFNPDGNPLNMKTTFNAEIRYRLSPELIEFQTWQDDFLSNEMRKISSQYIDLQNKVVKEALTELGWTPPSVDEGEREGYLRCEFKRVRDDKNRYLSMYNEVKEELDSFKEAMRKFVSEEENDVDL